MLIAEKPRHGYEIATELRKIGFPIMGIAQMGSIYRTLASLEASGYVLPEWDMSFSPPRKIYKITPLGIEYLEQVKIEVTALKDLIDAFAKKLEKLGGEG